MKILIANPNTSTDMLALMLEEAHRGCRPGTEVAGIAADFGVPYIASHSEMAIAGHALLDSLARHHEGHDAVVVGAFCHAFVAAAKELMPVPVIGLAEAGVRAAQIHGRRICIIGLGASRTRSGSISSGAGMWSAGGVFRCRGRSWSRISAAQTRPWSS